jgi:hypothetical protein
LQRLFPYSPFNTVTFTFAFEKKWLCTSLCHEQL